MTRSSTPLTTRLVADVGGTNTRLALFDPAVNQFRAVSTYTNLDHAGLEDIIGLWLSALEEPAPLHCCIAVAAPPAGDLVRMININWSFSCRELAQRFKFTKLGWVNDFEGNAYALPHLNEADRELLQEGGSDTSSHKLATMGPGTGLGGSTVEVISGTPIACACEPGHMGLAAATELELEVFRLLQPQYGEIHAELLVSGPGLQRLYLALAKIRHETVKPLAPSEISRRALQENDELCVLTLSIFCALLGSICGDFVLASGAYAGLYLAGGIIPRMIPFLRASDFTLRFRDKGAMGGHLSKVPLYVITTAQPGLIGAAHAPI